MINRFQVRNFKALRHISLELTPIHALIGPNDSGKTTILSALTALSRSSDLTLEQSFAGRWEGRDLVWHGDPEGVVGLMADMSNEGGERLQYSLECRFPNAGRTVRIESEKITTRTEIDCTEKGHKQTQVRAICVGNSSASDDILQSCRSVHRALSGVHYFRWNPRMLALPVAPDSTRRFRLNSDGFGLAQLLDDILGFDRKRFDEMEHRFTSIFPEIKSIKLVRQMGFRAPIDDIEQVSKLDQGDGKGLTFELSEPGQLVPASQVSDGAMLVLAYLALLYSPQPPRLLLIEEPENGIHPRRLQDVLAILREVVKAQSHTQIVLTTHSPYAVDLFSSDEVTLCTKSGDGAVEVTRMSDSKAVRDQLSLFTLGEIWTAEGDEDLAKGHAVSSP